MEFSNKVVIITGGATDIGRETARAFLERGANVVLNGRREIKLQEAITALDTTGKRVAYLAGDIGRPYPREYSGSCRGRDAGLQHVYE